MLLKVEIFNKKTQGKGLKILTSKQMFQILPIVLSQVKAGSTSENLQQRKLLKKYLTI